jgi:catechol 2,3-dioxygenase-like lactoylglutathione lyase family enzyme
VYRFQYSLRPKGRSAAHGPSSRQLLTPSFDLVQFNDAAVGRVGQKTEGAMPTYGVDPTRAHAEYRQSQKTGEAISALASRQVLPRRGRIRAGLPRFQNLNDAQILDAQFKLGDAQQLVARRLGFENWQALKAGASTMQANQEPAQAKPILTTTEAVLYVSDFPRACDYFVAKLGFEIEFAYGEPPFYGLVKRDRARLCLRLVCKPVFAGNVRETEQLLSAVFTVDTAAEIKELFRAFQSAEVDFFQKLKTEPWGARNFIVKDPDGNLLLFAGPSDREPVRKGE